jgi:hypothetical protein
VNDVLELSRTAWRRLGVAPEVAEEMADELRADLDAAAEAGIEPLRYVGGDAEAFATAWARERGVVRPRPRLVATGLAAFLGAVPGVGFSLFVAYGMSNPAMKDILGFDLGRHPIAIVSLYILGALFACGGAVAVVGGWLNWQEDLAASQTVGRLLTAVPLAAVAAVGLAMAVGASRHFSTSAKVVAAEVLVAALVFVVVVTGVRFIAVRNLIARGSTYGTANEQ